MGSSTSGRPEQGSYAAGGSRSKRPWWLWLIAAVILIALLLLLLSRCGGDSSDSQDSSAGAESASPAPTPAPTSTASASTSATPTPSPSSGADPSAGDGSGGDTATGTLVAGGEPVLTAQASSALGDVSRFAGEPVTAKGAVVQSVPADKGFWVGPSKRDRVWVQLAGSRETPYAVEKGDTVDFSGARMVRHGSGFAGQVGVSPAEGRAQLDRQMAHVRVSQETVSLHKA